ncbi:MAG: aspartyl protease family protein [Solimonas sp.]
MRMLPLIPLLLALALGWSSHTQAAEAAPRAILKLEPYANILSVRASVNGHAGRFLLDTGGGLTVLSPGFAGKAGCKPWGRLVGHTMMANRIDMQRCDGLSFDLAGLAVKKATVGILDLGPMLGPGAEPVDGLIALDLFAEQAITFDAGAGQLIVESPASLRARTARAQELPVRFTREMQGLTLSASVELRVADGPLYFEIDTGNGGVAVLVAKPYAALFGLDPEAKGGQHLSRRIAPGIDIETDAALAPDIILDGNLGLPVLRNWIVTLDLHGGRLWLSPGSSAPRAGTAK